MLGVRTLLQKVGGGGCGGWRWHPHTFHPSSIRRPAAVCSYCFLLALLRERCPPAACCGVCDSLSVPIVTPTTLEFIPLCEDRGARVAAWEHACGSETVKEGRRSALTLQQAR